MKPCSTTKREAVRSRSFSAATVSSTYWTVRSNSAVEFLHRLADLEHDQADHAIALPAHGDKERLDMRDAVGDRHGRPDPPAAIISCDRGVERLQRLGAVEPRMAAETQRVQSVVALGADGRQHVVDRTVPGQNLAVTQVGAVIQGDADGERRWRKRLRPGKSGHAATSFLVREPDRIAWRRRYQEAGRRSRFARYQAKRMTVVLFREN